MKVVAEQATKQLEQKTVREHLRPAEGAGHPQSDVVARAPDAKEPVRRRLVRLALHCAPVEGSELREIVAMHRLNDSGRKGPTEQDATVLVESGTRSARGL